MKRFLLLLALWALPVLVAGCFRSAGDTVEPTQDADTSAAALVVTLAPTGDAPTSAVPLTPGLPPITVLPSATRVPPTEQPAEASATRSPQTIVPPPSATPQFITPGSPLGPVPFVTSEPQAQPVNVSGESTAEAGGISAGGVEADPEATRNADPCIYVVQSGDSLYGIAVEYDTTIDDLLAVNPTLEGDPPIIYPDDELNLPDCGDGTTRVAPTRQPTSAPTRAGSATGTPSGAGEVYTVQSGDTLFNIAGRYGITIADIVAANPGMDPDRLSIGQRIIIPPDED